MKYLFHILSLSVILLLFTSCASKSIKNTYWKGVLNGNEVVGKIGKRMNGGFAIYEGEQSYRTPYTDYMLDCEVYDDDKVVFVGMKYFVDADGNSKGKGEPISFTGVFRGDILDVNFPEGFVQLIKRY